MLALIPLAIQIAPEIAKWLFGDGAAHVTETVAQAIHSATGVDPSADGAAGLVSSVLASKPDVALDLRAQLAKIASDNERAERESENALLIQRLNDAADARAQTVALAKLHSSIAWGPVAISLIVLATFGTVMWAALTHALPSGSETILNMLLGTLAAMATSVVSYWVGSSAGSDKKTDFLLRSKPDDSGGRQT